MAEELDEPVFLNWEEYWAIAVRRRWWILLSVFFVWGAVWGLSWLLPSTYQSEALILLEQQKVPDQFVAPNVSDTLQDRVQSISQQILSRTRLQATIDRFHLYSTRDGLRSRLLKSRDPVELMRNDITIELVRAPGHPGEFTAFKMRYVADSPSLARQVNNELTSLFVRENVQAQQQLSEDTTTFLESQLADARIKMEEQEAKVAAFKAKHLGELPTQLESNVQILAGIQAQLQSTEQSLDAARQQRLYMESLLQQYRSSASLDGSGAGSVLGDSSGTTGSALDKELLTMRLHLQELQTRYTENHPDVVALKDKIAKAEQLRAPLESGETSRTTAATNSANPGSNAALQRSSSPSMMQLQSQLKANQLEIENDQQHEKDLESQSSSYRARLNMTPETEQELTDISRGYEESKSNYNSLLQKQMQSQLATNLEQRQKGEQFQLLDPPSLPIKPSAPNHFKMSLAGLGLGVVLGIALTALLEVADVRVRKERDLVGIVPVSVLVGIPHFSTPSEARSRALRWWTECGAAAVIMIVIAVGSLYAFAKG